MSRRDTILDVAAQSFLENGYAGTTMSGIAAALGGSKGTLWSYFPSKELLFAAVIERVSSSFRAELTLILNPADAFELALERFCAQFLRKVTSAEAIALHRLVIGEAARFPEVGRIFHADALRRMQELLSQFLLSAMSRGLLRRVEPLRAAQHLTGLCMSRCYQLMLIASIDHADEGMIQADVKSALDTFLRAYRA